MSETEEYRTFPEAVRVLILERDEYRCQICGRLGPERGGDIDLEAHHIEDDPADIDRDHPDNGTTLCIPCHHLVTHRPTADDLPFDLDSVAAEVNLLYKDIEVLMFLYRNGPATTSEIIEATSCGARPATIERLWKLMSADRRVDSLDEPIIDKDAETEKWGAPGDIDSTVRGQMPISRAELMDSLSDELLRRLLDAGVTHSALAELFNCSIRSTFYKEKRAGALRVPLDDESTPDAPVDEEQFEQVVDGLSAILGGVDDVQANR